MAETLPGCLPGSRADRIPAPIPAGGGRSRGRVVATRAGPDSRRHLGELEADGPGDGVGRNQAGKLDAKGVHAIECEACPGAGSCGGMYTANTMSSAIESMGLSLPYDASNPAVSAAKERETFQAGQALVRLIEKNIKPRDIITRKSLENAYTFVLA